jgi:pentatricopeptide repeat protein
VPPTIQTHLLSALLALGSSRHRTRPILSDVHSARHGLSGIWKRKHTRSFTCQAQATQYTDTGQAHHGAHFLIVDRFVNGEPLPNSSHFVDLKAAWSAFTELRKQSAPPHPSVVLAFVDRALSIIEEKLSHGDNMRELVRWSVRLRRTIRQLGDAQNLPSYDSVHALCLLTRTEALLGRFDEVASRFPRIWDHRTQEEAYRLGHPELRMVETVLQALYHHRGAVAVLDFIVSQWDTLGRLVNMSPSRRHSRVPAKLNDIAFKIFDRIPSPVAVVANKRGKREWDVIRTGSLLIRYLIRRRVPEDALAVYKEMQRQSIDITPPLKLWLVRALAQGHAIEQANMLFSQISASVPVGHEDELSLRLRFTCSPVKATPPVPKLLSRPCGTKTWPAPERLGCGFLRTLTMAMSRRYFGTSTITFPTEHSHGGATGCLPLYRRPYGAFKGR